MERFGVILVESPTVENAETVSNAIGIRPLLPSLILSINIAINMVDAEKKYGKSFVQKFGGNSSVTNFNPFLSFNCIDCRVYN